MSSRSKKGGKEPEKEPSGLRRVVLQKPAGPVPEATVMARHGGRMISRGSKGFSFGEVRSSGADLGTVRKWGLPLDIRRRSVLEHNVAGLKSWYPEAKPVERPQGELRKIEKEVEKIGKEAETEVKKGMAKARKETARVEKEVKKVEKVAVEKVEKPVKSRKGAKKPAKGRDKGKRPPKDE